MRIEKPRHLRTVRAAFLWESRRQIASKGRGSDAPVAPANHPALRISESGLVLIIAASGLKDHGYTLFVDDEVEVGARQALRDHSLDRKSSTVSVPLSSWRVICADAGKHATETPKPNSSTGNLRIIFCVSFMVLFYVKGEKVVAGVERFVCVDFNLREVLPRVLLILDELLSGSFFSVKEEC
jgi:hypothetical protein